MNNFDMNNFDMNNFDMKNQQLMIHVERIVKPVSAMQGRKLRMRTELLTHLEASLEEERLRVPGDEQGAIERATIRLGKPAELTKSLQQTVPAVEAALLVRLPLSNRAARFEQQMARIPGKRGPMTLGHITTLSAMATLSCAPLFVLLWMLSSRAAAGFEPAHPLASVLGTLVAWPLLFHEAVRFVFEAASPDERFDWAGTLRRGAVLLAVQMGLTFFLAASIADRCATSGEVVASAVSTVAFLAIAALVSRWVGVQRRPFDEWLSLDVAG